MAITKNHFARIQTIRAAITRTKQMIAKLESAAPDPVVNELLQSELRTLKKLQEVAWYAKR